MRVAVFGAGYAGLTLARRLEKRLPDTVDLVVVDEDGRHVLQHELHRVVRHPNLAADISLDLDDVLDAATIREARVTDLDPETGVAHLAPETDGAHLDGNSDGGDTAETLEYDYAAVCLGARTAFYDLPGVEEHATPLKRLDHAATIRENFLAAADASDPEQPGTILVGGAGLSGIQVAGELAALAREEGVSDALDVVLLEQEHAVAPRFPENFQRTVREELETRDVTVRTGVAVERADSESVTLEDGTTLQYNQFVWTGGIRGPGPLGEERPVIRNTLRLGDGTFVVGDAGRVIDTDGEAVPASAQSAVREARVAAANLATLVEYDLDGGSGFEPRLERFTFDSPGWLVSVGDGAVAQVGPTVLTGRAAKALKTSVGAGYLTAVGSVENAVDLVREEVGWPAGDEESVESNEE